MTICLVIGIVLMLSIVAGVPEIFERLENWMTEIQPQSQQDFDFVEGIELYGEFWFQKDEQMPQRVWRQKNAKCGWAPEPPMKRKILEAA